VISLVVVVGDEVPESGLQLLSEVVVLKLDHVLHRPVIALDFALRLRAIGSAASVSHAALAQIFPELTRQVGRVVVAEKPRSMFHPQLIDARDRQRLSG